MPKVIGECATLVTFKCTGQAIGRATLIPLVSSETRRGKKMLCGPCWWYAKQSGMWSVVEEPSWEEGLEQEHGPRVLAAVKRLIFGGQPPALPQGRGGFDDEDWLRR